MGDFVDTAEVPTNFICTTSPQSLGAPLTEIANAGGASALAWPTANKAIFVPFYTPTNFLVASLACFNGTVGGNVDMGIYDTEGSRIVSNGSVAQTGSSVPQIFNVTATWLAPGQYYFALASSLNTGTFFSYNNSSFTLLVPHVRAFGVFGSATSFPLPASVTFQQAVDAYIPIVVATSETVL